MITIGIKALNEERHIAAAIASAQAALANIDASAQAAPANIDVSAQATLANIGPSAQAAPANIAASAEAPPAAAPAGEVVLADSGSTDATVAIARAIPGVRIVRLANPAEACCGAGAQLAFQAARGAYFYLLDGDMRLDRDFLAHGLAFLAANPGHAGVGGRVREADVTGIEFELRRRIDRTGAREADRRARDVDRLDCGGLYRVAAIRAVGYFADRNLHSFEEFELAARLRAAGWRLARLDVPGVDHHGHALPALALMWRRLRSGYAGGAGEVLRGALGRRHLGQVLRRFSNMWIALVVIGWWLALLAAAAGGRGWALAALLVAPFAAMAWRGGGLRMGAYLVAVWNLAAAGLILGFVRPRVDPHRPLAMIDLTPPAGPAPSADPPAMCAPAPDA